MDNIGYLLMKVSKDLRYILSKELKLHGLTSSQWAVLKRLEMEEASNSSLTNRTSVEIATKLEFDKPTISGIVTRLHEKGMIKKEQHPSDKRASILFLTQEAKHLIPTLEAVSNSVIEESLRYFSTEEKEVFVQLLMKIESTISKEQRL
jgi:DNA-binding MarR family transcriptional regulator